MALIIHPTFQLYEKKHMPFCSSLQVAESFDKKHKHVLEDISRIGNEPKSRPVKTETGNAPKSGLVDTVANFFKANFIRTKYTDKKGEKRPMYLMTKDGFTLLVMSYTGEKAMSFKVAYIKRFNEMEEYIKRYVLATDDFPPFTQAIKDAYDEPQSYHYSNECDLINRIVLGCTAKQFKETHGLGDVPSIRPFLSDIQAKAIRKLQTEDIRLLYTGVEFQDRKDRLVTFYSQKYDIPVLAS